MNINARDILRDKKTFTTVNGTVLDITFTPYGISIMSEKYADQQLRIGRFLKEYDEISKADPKTLDVNNLEAKIKEFNDLRKETAENGTAIIIETLRMNGREIDNEGLNKLLVREEFPLLLEEILGISSEIKKKFLNSNKRSRAGNGHIPKRLVS